jgi:intracellular septation protein A
MFQKEETVPELQNAVETIYRNDENQIALLILKWQISSWNWPIYFFWSYYPNGYILEEISKEFKNMGIIPMQQYRKAH